MAVSIVLSVTRYSGNAIFALLLVLLVSLAMIWFPKELNDLSFGGWHKGMQIDQKTPEFMIAGFGWIVLVATLVAVYSGVLNTTTQ